MGRFSLLTVTDVVDESTFARYCHQRIGTPMPSAKDFVILRRKLNDFFKTWQPRPEWITLGRTVEWCQAKKRRPAHSWAVVGMVRYAWADGFLPELDRNHRDSTVENELLEALRIERDPDWRMRLLAAPSDCRVGVLAAWHRKDADVSPL